MPSMKSAGGAGERELSVGSVRVLPWLAFELPAGEAWLTMELPAAAWAMVPLGVVLASILLPPLRPASLLLGVAATALLRARGSPAAWSWAATVPLAAILTWGLLPPPAVLPNAASCASLLSPPMLWRVAELGIVMPVIAVLALWLGPGRRRHLPFSRPPSWLVGLATIGAFIIAPVSLLVGEEAARPFFGPVHLQITVAGAVLPAVIFAFANATLEESVYRGVLLGWMERSLGTGVAIVAQAAAFGLAHTGPDFVGSPIPVLLSMFVAGAIAGLIVKRTGSLLVPIVIHAAFDVPLYYSLACRIS